MMVACTHEAIATGPTGNLQGSVKFYCLNTGRILKRMSFTPLPMPDRIIKRVNQIGSKEKQGRTFRFLNRKKEPYEWTDEVPEDDPEFQGLLEDKVKMAAYPDISTKIPGVELKEDEHNFQVVTDNPEPDFAALAAAALDNAGIDPHNRLHAAQQSQQQQAANPAPPTGPAMIEADEDKIVYEITFDLPDAGLGTGMAVPPDDIDPTAAVTFEPTAAAVPDNQRQFPTRLRRSEIGHQPNVREPIAHRTRSQALDASQTTFLQLGKTRVRMSVMEGARYVQMSKEERMHATTWSNVSHLESQVDDTVHMMDPALITSLEDELKVWGYVMTQYNIKPGLRKFGVRGEKAAMNELTQLHIMDTWTAMDALRLSREEQLKALSSLLFLKEKQTGAIKGRAGINGAPQREYILKEEAASPTVSVDLTFITATIAAIEKRKVRCYDVPSAFVNTDVDEDVLMVQKGELADMMVQIAPQVYIKYVMVDRKGTPILYVKLQKALYRLMKASLLFYRKLRKELEAYGLTINPYDPCIVNVTTSCGKQLTIVWHVDY
jgi:hypothetical protein